jgi:hypothetical protein
MKLAVVGDSKVQVIVKFMRLGYHLAEPLAVSSSPKLVAAFMEFHRLGHFIMMDNGAAEVSKVHPDGAVTHVGPPPLFEQVVRTAAKIGADEIILPDKKKDIEWTLKHTLEGAELVPPCMRAVVPQGKDENEWKECFEAFEDKMEFTTICVTKDYDRYDLLTWLGNQDATEYYRIHLLGISGKPDVETELVTLVRSYPWVRGIDSAIAIAYAQNHWYIGDKAVSRPSYQWGHEFPRITARNNIRMLMEWCKDDTYNH